VWDQPKFSLLKSVLIPARKDTSSARWTVASPAKEAAMSHLGLCGTIRCFGGVGAHAILAGLRMSRAREALIAEPSLTLAELSARTGYDSEASFSRASKRAYGVTPGSVRRAQADEQ